MAAVCSSSFHLREGGGHCSSSEYSRIYPRVFFPRHHEVFFFFPGSIGRIRWGSGSCFAFQNSYSGVGITNEPGRLYGGCPPPHPRMRTLPSRRPSIDTWGYRYRHPDPVLPCNPARRHISAGGYHDRSSRNSSTRYRTTITMITNRMNPPRETGMMTRNRNRERMNQSTTAATKRNSSNDTFFFTFLRIRSILV